jgi:hypothetical protein
MKQERDLLPWIFGGLSAAAIAVAFAAVSTHRAAPTLLPSAMAAAAVASAPALPALPAPATAQTPPQPLAPPVQADSGAVPAPAQPQTEVEPAARAGQIWECSTKGVKTFSNNPCGENSTLLDVGPVNTMSPIPAIHYARAYSPAPGYAAGYADQNAADPQDYSDPTTADTGGNYYTIVQGVGLVSRRRPEHLHRPPPPAAHHNPAPVRRY